MPAPWIKGYSSTDPRNTSAPNRMSDDAYRPPGEAAVAVKKRWQNVPEAYPYGEAEDEGGGGGGDA